ncbi:MAG: hypothetical protein NVS1B12_03550 [Acidimicrobiales bacterium]
MGTAIACGLTLVGGGAALAVSGGGYSSQGQDCSPNADAFSTQGAEPGCHNFKVNVTDGHGQRYAEVGLDQLPQGPSIGALAGVATPGSPNFPHAGCAAVNTNGTQGGKGRNCGSNRHGVGAAAVFDTQNPGRNKVTTSTGTPDAAALASSVASGFDLYLGADDNLDAGEHDGVDGLARTGTKRSVNGPSDGGAVTAHVSPKAATARPSLRNPVPAAGASEGACADGFCEETTTQRQAVYHGGPKGSRSVADYGNKQWDPYNCSSGDLKGEKACKSGTHDSMDAWRRSEAADVYAEPGVQVYEDPDPQGSPIDPVYEAGLTPSPMLYPIPGAYAGTCGVVAGGGPVLSAPAGTPGTNGAGQVVVSTGC